jgi:AAA family ATP:ADP antiporter
MGFLSKIKEAIWPIEKSELKLFAPMALMMFCTLFNFSALRSVKDALVIPALGAEVISFLKLWVVLPSALIFTIVYVKLSNIFSAEKVFYIIVSSFLIIFWIFTYVIYPNQDIYHPSSESIVDLIHQFPNFKWFFKIASKWGYIVMYIFGELWSVVVINLMFWQFANHVIDTSKARRFYPILAMIGNLGLILAGNAIVYFADTNSICYIWLSKLTPNALNTTEITLKLVVMAITIVGICAMFILRYIHTHVFIHVNPTEVAHNPYATQTSLSMKESIKLILSSKYIGYILVMVMCYGLVINVIEGPWKDKLKELYPSTNEYLAFMGHFNIWMGSSCVIMTILGSNILRRSSWFVAALITPFMMAITGTLFFVFIIWGSKIDDIFSFSPLYAAVLAGAAQNILGKSAKYSLFDSTKEMAYIPLSVELRTKGKAAAEIVGMKLGKSLGAFVQSFIFILWPMATFESITPMLMIVFLLVIAVWFIDLRKLNKEYKKLS